VVNCADEDVGHICSGMVAFNRSESKLFGFQFPVVGFVDGSIDVMARDGSPGPDVHMSKVNDTLPGMVCYKEWVTI
jgi:hypothetical protein